MTTSCSYSNKMGGENSKPKDSQLEVYKQFMNKLNQPPNFNKKLTLPNKAVFWEGWIKYFHYSTGDRQSKPTHFFINNAFFNQKVLKKLRAQKDSNGYLFIPTKFHFYAKLMKNSFNILSARQEEFKETVDILNLDMITPIKPENPFKGSIVDLGNFAEGNCFNIGAIVPTDFDKEFQPKEGSNNGRPQNWVVCLNTPKQKDKLYTILLTYKLLRQKKQELVENEDKPAVSLGGLLGDKPKEIVEKYKGSDANPQLDGYLVLINDWTQCTLKCGGGYSYQQWRCIPPKPKGKACQGKLIRMKKCNMNKCPNVGAFGDSSNDSKDTIHVTAKPIIKSLPVSTRPQQYVKCLIRENDVMYKSKDSETGQAVKIPSRLIMNTRTVSLFSDTAYENSIFNFFLKRTDIVPNSNDFCCFYIQSETQKFEICGMNSECGTDRDPKFVREWQAAFGLFKNKCFNTFEKDIASKSIKKLPSKDNPNNDDSDNAGGMNLAVADVQARQELLSKKLADSMELDNDHKIDTTQKTAMKAINREIDLEELIKREEIIKAKQEAKSLLAVMKREVQKQRKLKEILQDREQANYQLRENKKVKHTLEQIKKEAKQEVVSKRSQLKLKINAIRQKSSRRKRLIEQKINLIRGKIAREIMLANKAGSSEVCKKNFESQSSINNYCNEYIIDEYAKNKGCKEKTNFCYVCCENEFGNMRMVERDQCYDMCDKLMREATSTGDFIWANSK